MRVDDVLDQPRSHHRGCAEKYDQRLAPGLRQRVRNCQSRGVLQRIAEAGQQSHGDQQCAIGFRELEQVEQTEENAGNCYVCVGTAAVHADNRAKEDQQPANNPSGAEFESPRIPHH